MVKTIGSDPASIFHKQINFIQKTGIVTAMVGLLNAPKGTKLYQRLKALEAENRRLKQIVAEQALDNLTLKELLSKNF
jgi:hypothetical protein